MQGQPLPKSPFRLSESIILIALLVVRLASETPVLAINTVLTNTTPGGPSGPVPVLTLGSSGNVPSLIVTNATAVDLGAHLHNLKPVNSAPNNDGKLQVVRQQNALRLLNERAGDGLQVHLREGNRTAVQIRGKALEKPARIAKADPGERDAQTARQFLRFNRELLRIDDPDNELVVVQREQDALGHAHLKFDQTFRGIPLWPSGVKIHLEPNGIVYLFDGAYVPTPNEVGIVPVLTAGEATARAQTILPGGEKGTVTPPTLIIYSPLDKPARLAWKLNLSTSGIDAWIMVIDALDGRVLNQISQVMDANVTASPKDLLGKNRDLNVWSQEGKFYMFDTSKQMFKAGSDPLVQSTAGVIRVYDGEDKTTDEVFKSAATVTTTDLTKWLPDAVSAAFNFSVTYDYYLKHHGRNSLDANGGGIIAIVRVSDQKHNAAWVGQHGLMVFGDDLPLPAGLDVIGHELTHGITEKTAGLIYQDQPGALNEAFSDIFGEFVEASRDGQPDWQLGEEINFIFRNMKDPGAIKDPDLGPLPSKMSEFKRLPANFDHGGVHINSSIINHACYLLVAGLNGALGLADSEKIFYRCLTQHLQNQSQFIDARLGCIASAEALFGTDSVQAKKVAEAFDAVEIFATPATPEPSPIPTVQGPDATLLIGFDPSVFEVALGRAEAALGDPSDGVALVESVKEARPAVSGDGSFALFVDSADDLCAVNTNDPRTLQCLGFRGLVHSVAVSPNGQLAAYVLRDPATGQPVNQINIYDFTRNSTKTFKLLSPVADGTSINDVLYADSMVFTSDSKVLIYDAVAQMRFAGGQPVQRWSIFAINLATETASVLLPPQEGFDTGNPNIGRAGNRYLTFDARNVQTGNTSVLNLDLFNGDLKQVGSVGRGLGFPCFTGDESAVIYATQDPTAFFTGYSLVKQPLASDRLTTTGSLTLWVPDASIGVIYRRGAFVSSNAPPQVRITSPADGQNFAIPGQFSLEATATDADGQIAKVEFYDGDDKLLEVTAPPFRLTVDFDQNAKPHQFRFIARAVDNLGGVTDSSPVNVSVSAGPGPGTPIQLAATRLTNKAVHLIVTSSAGNYTIQQSADLKTWTDMFPVTIGASLSASVDDPSDLAATSRRFYRVRRN